MGLHRGCIGLHWSCIGVALGGGCPNTPPPPPLYSLWFVRWLQLDDPGLSLDGHGFTLDLHQRFGEVIWGGGTLNIIQLLHSTHCPHPFNAVTPTPHIMPNASIVPDIPNRLGGWDGDGGAGSGLVAIQPNNTEATTKDQHNRNKHGTGDGDGIGLHEPGRGTGGYGAPPHTTTHPHTQQ